MHSTITIESIDSEFVPPQHKNAKLKDYLAKISSFLIPYFSVPNKRIPHRLVSSLAPPFFFKEFRRVYSDMKGPVLILLFLSFILFYGLLSPERSLISNIFLILKLTFGYWIFFSIMAFFLGYFCETCLTLSQYFSISGYSLTGHCFVLVIAEILHQEESNSIFLFLLTVFGGLATGRLIVIILARTPKPAQRLLICSCLACIHLMHLVYIHYAFMRRKLNLD